MFVHQAYIHIMQMKKIIRTIKYRLSDNTGFQRERGYIRHESFGF